jgi:hypothetical protein
VGEGLDLVRGEERDFENFDQANLDSN